MKRKLEANFNLHELGYHMYWPHGMYPGFYKVLGRRMRMNADGAFNANGYSVFRPKSYWDWYKPMGRMDDMESLTHRGRK